MAKRADLARVKEMVDKARALLSDPGTLAELIKERKAISDRIHRKYDAVRRFTGPKARRLLHTPLNAALHRNR